MDEQIEYDVRSKLAWGQQVEARGGELRARQTPMEALSSGTECSSCATPVGSLAEVLPNKAAYDVVNVSDWESWRADPANAGSVDPFDLAAAAPAPMCLQCAVTAMVAE